MPSERAGVDNSYKMVAGGATVRGSSEKTGGSSNYGRSFVMFHGTSWRNWQIIKRQGFRRSEGASGLGVGVYLTRNERKAEFYKETKWGVIVKVRVRLGKIVVIDRQGHPLQKSWQLAKVRIALRLSFCTCRGDRSKRRKLCIGSKPHHDFGAFARIQACL